RGCRCAERGGKRSHPHPDRPGDDGCVQRGVRPGLRQVRACGPRSCPSRGEGRVPARTRPRRPGRAAGDGPDAARRGKGRADPPAPVDRWLAGGAVGRGAVRVDGRPDSGRVQERHAGKLTRRRAAVTGRREPCHRRLHLAGYQEAMSCGTRLTALLAPLSQFRVRSCSEARCCSPCCAPRIRRPPVSAGVIHCRTRCCCCSLATLSGVLSDGTVPPSTGAEPASVAILAPRTPLYTVVPIAAAVSTDLITALVPAPFWPRTRSRLAASSPAPPI